MKQEPVEAVIEKPKPKPKKSRSPVSIEKFTVSLYAHVKMQLISVPRLNYFICCIFILDISYIFFFRWIYMFVSFVGVEMMRTVYSFVMVVMTVTTLFVLFLLSMMYPKVTGDAQNVWHR